MSDFNEPAFPVQEFDHQLGVDMPIGRGLTIRQQAVLMAMQGILAGGAIALDKEMRDAYAIAACHWADAVLRAERESRDER